MPGAGRIVDLDPDPNLTFYMLEPVRFSNGSDWTRVAHHIANGCDTLWVHWWFRPPNDRRPIVEQLIDSSAKPAPEPLPALSELDMGRLAYFAEEVAHSWVCPNGAAARIPMSGAALELLLNGGDLRWWDLHLYRRGRRLFTATDGGTEHFARLSPQDMVALREMGFPRDDFRAMRVGVRGSE